MSSILPWLQQYMHVYPVHTCIYWHRDGGDVCQYMQVYVCISIKNTCIYIKQYMNVFPTVYLAVYLYVFPTVFLAVFFVHVHTATVPSRLLRIRRRLRAVSASAPSPRGRYGKFVARQRKRRQIATFNEIRSARLNSGSQQRLVQARPCRTAMAILVGSRSLGNRRAATCQWHWNDEKFIESTTTAEKAILGFLEPTAHRNPSTEKQRKRLKNY